MSRRAVLKAEPQPGTHASAEGLSVGQLMGCARTSLLNSLDAQLERFGLNSAQFTVLKHLSEGRARTAADLCRLHRYDTGAMTRILDRLEERGLVRRERAREDRRVVWLRLAPQGRALLPRLLSVATRVVDAHLAGFSATEIGALKEYLRRMIDNGQEHAALPPSNAGGRA